MTAVSAKTRVSLLIVIVLGIGALVVGCDKDRARIREGLLMVGLYERRGVELVFDDGDLMAWKTDKTVQELRAPDAK